MLLSFFYFLIVPRATFLVFFVVPMPAIAVVGLFAAYDIYKASTVTVSLIYSTQVIWVQLTNDDNLVWYN